MRIRDALFHNTIWRLLGLPLGFFSNVLIVRIMGAEPSGQFFYYLTAVTLMATFLRFGLENGIVFFGSASGKVRKQIRTILAGVSLFQIIASYFLIKAFAPASDIPVHWPMMFVMTDIFFYYQTAFNQSRKMFRITGIAALWLLIAQTIILALIHFGKYDVKGFEPVMIILTLASAGKMIYAVIWSLRSVQNDHAPEVETKPLKLFSFFKWSMLNYVIAVLIFLITRADLWFVERYCLGLELSNYLQASRLTQMILVVPAMAGGVIFRYAVTGADDFESSFRKITGGISMLCAVFYLLLAALGHFLFPRIFGTEFSGIYGITIILFPGVYFLTLTLLLSSYFEGKNRQLLSIAAMVIVFVVLMVADYLLVPVFGVYAAAIAFSGSMLIGAVFMLLRYHGMSGIRPHRMLFAKLSDIEFLRAFGLGRENS